MGCGGCTRLVCGEPEGEWKGMLEEAGRAYPEFEIRDVGCEPYYVYVYLREGVVVDTNAVHGLHGLLFDAERGVGRPVMWVHGTDGGYLFSHGYTGRIGVQRGD